MSTFFRLATVVVVTCVTVTNLALASDPVPHFPCPLAPFDRIVDGHTISQTVEENTPFPLTIKVGEIEGSADGQRRWLRITRWNTRHQRTVYYCLELSTVPRTQRRSRKNAVWLGLSLASELKKVMPDEIVADSRSWGAPHEVFHCRLDADANISSVSSTYFNAFGCKKLELTSSFSGPKVTKFETLHGSK